MDGRIALLFLALSGFYAFVEGKGKENNPDQFQDRRYDGSVNQKPLKRRLLAESSVTSDTMSLDHSINKLKSETSRLLSDTSTTSLSQNIINIQSYTEEKLDLVNSYINEISLGAMDNGTVYNASATMQATKIISIVEDLGALALRLITSQEYSVTIGVVDMLVLRKNFVDFNGFEYSSKGKGYTTSVSVPKEAKLVDMAGVVGFSIQGIEDILSADTNGSVVTPIASCTVMDMLGRRLPVTTLDPVTIIFGYHGNGPNVAKSEVAVCSFVQMDANGKFRGWSEEQCALVSQSDEKIVCRCTHLTAFAVLYRKEGIAEQLQILSWVGCAFTTLSCLITAMTMVGYRLLDSTSSFVRMNFLMSLGMSEAIFLAGIRYTDIPAVCMIVAGFLHFTVLACFTWLFSYILLLGTEMRMTNVNRRTMTAGMYTVIGWLVPACIVTITLIARRQVYRDPYYCWISSRELLNLSLLVPAGVILIISWVILSYVVNMYHRRRKDKTIVSLLALSWSGIVSCTVISPLLTATWFLGTFSVTFRAIWLQALFTICNVVLGLTIFFFMCYTNAEVRTARKNRKITPTSLHAVHYKPTFIKNTHTIASCESDDCIHKSRCFYGQKVSSFNELGQPTVNLGFQRQHTWQPHEKRRPGTSKLSDILYKKTMQIVPERSNSQTDLLSGETNTMDESSF